MLLHRRHMLVMFLYINSRSTALSGLYVIICVCLEYFGVLVVWDWPLWWRLPKFISTLNLKCIQSDIEIQLSICLIVARRIVRTEAIAQMNFDRTVVWEGDPAVLVALVRGAYRPEAPIFAQFHFYRVVSVRSAFERNDSDFESSSEALGL